MNPQDLEALKARVDEAEEAIERADEMLALSMIFIFPLIVAFPFWLVQRPILTWKLNRARHTALIAKEQA